MIDLVSRHRFLLALSMLAGLAAGVALCSLLPPVFQSTAQVLVGQKRPDLMVSVDTRQGTADDSLATHLELLKSTTIIDRAIRENNLAGLPSLQDEKETPTEVIRKGLTVSRGKGTGAGNNVLQVSYRGRVADECTLILAAVLDSYRRFLGDKYQVVAGDTLELVLRERADLEKELERKEVAYREFLEKSPLVQRKPEGSDLSRDRLVSIQARRSALLLRRAELQSQLDRIEAAQKQGSDRETILALIAEFAHKGDEPLVARPTLVATASDQLTPLLLEEQKLLERYGADHPEVRSVRKRIAIARSFQVVPAAAWDDPKGADPAQRRGDPVQRHVQILRQKLQHVTEAAEQMRKLFDEEREEARKETRKLARYEIQDEAFRAGITLARQTYEALNKRLQDAHLVKGAGGYDIEVVSPPSRSRQVSPSLTLTLPVTAVLGLLAALGLLAFREATTRRLRSPEDVRRQVGLPILGYIPFSTASARRRARPTSPLADPLVGAHHRPHSTEAEAHRSLRNSLFFQAREPARKVLQITSPSGGAGKSVLAANLAVSMAQAGKKVLLLEADLRHPRLAELFRQAPRGGLGQVLAGEAEPAAVIQESGIPGLSVLFAGPPPSHFSDLLPSPRFQALLGRLREDYDFVLVDSPALLATTEASAVAAGVDGVLLAVRLRRDSRPALERSLEVLESVGAHVLGVVVNGATPPTSSAASRFTRRIGSQDASRGTDAQAVSNGSAGLA